MRKGESSAEMSATVSVFDVSSLYANEQIYKSLGVGNTGGIRVKKDADGEVKRIALFTSIPTPRQLEENPYHDRMEGDTLIYTGAGKAGEQTVAGANARIREQQIKKFPIYAFIQVAGRRDTSVGIKRWGFLGLLEYMRGYQEQQVDSRNEKRMVWIFEFRVHSVPLNVSIARDGEIMRELLATSQDSNDADREVVPRVCETPETSGFDLIEIEDTRRQLLSYEPEQFEHVISNILRFSGFGKVDVTRYSQDGGIDINARLEWKTWPLRHLLTQVQAKRWLHTVGRKEVAELRGSLQPHAAGCIVTTSHFSRAAIAESMEPGKIPITVIDGYELARIVKSIDFGSKSLTQNGACVNSSYQRRRG